MYVLIMFCVFLQVDAIINFNEQLGKNVYEIDNETPTFENCLCVPYWHCKEDFSGLVEDTTFDDKVDIRTFRQRLSPESAPCTGDFDVCCQVQCGKRRRIKSQLLDYGGEEDPSLDYDFDGIESDLSYRKKYQYSKKRLLTRFNPKKRKLGLRILGENNEAEFAEFPWMLGILEGNTFKCGGSLIHPQVAMTAAHCVGGNGPFKIRAGEWNWKSTEEAITHQDRFVKKIIPHRSYHPGSLRNDIALIIVDSPFRLAENVGVACIPPQGLVHIKPDCVTSGWGKNSYEKGTYQQVLKKMNLPIVPREKCVRTLREVRLGPTFHLHRSFICAGGEAQKDTCKGDGGSPLICPIADEEDRYEQSGIVSWGLTCGLRNTPGVYVNVALFSDWIDFQMKSHQFDTKIYRY